MRAALILLFLMCATPAAALTRLTALDAGANRITLKLDGPITAKVLALQKPLRLVVDLAGADAERQAAGGGGTVTAARIGQFDKETARLVIDIARPMRVATATVGEDRRLTITLVPSSAADFAAAAKRGRVPLALREPVAGPAAPRNAAPVGPLAKDTARPMPPTATDPDFDLPEGVFGPRPKAPPATVTPPARPQPFPEAAPPPRGRKPLVVIDAGHGGRDVGAVSSGDRYEKDVTLAITRVVAATLAKSGKVRVKLTRGDDRFIPLGGRVAIARAARADLFVSVHADSAPNTLARGASVYTLSDTASDAVAARLAARENKADIIGGVNLGVEAPEVGDVMIALLRRSTLNTAIGFAEVLQAELDDRIPFRGQFHHFAGFMVLKAADVPSVLLETGYISNEDDADFLFSKKGQRIVGEGIAAAIERHFSVSGVREQVLRRQP